ncbi:hypothetical protein GCM10027088_68220 [Nocardia goodfellowii]|uniref:Uncharacterized protein n=1 Tax=Nocardia goodfellowii TaxID=882446 RepID=A0ABS4QMM6_9NOCA|nr:hypothetical protein [Nocardia goodfellowii]
MSQPTSCGMQLLTEDQLNGVRAVTSALKTGSLEGVPEPLVDYIVAVRQNCKILTDNDFEYPFIPGAGGVLLEAFAARPEGDGPFPLVVLPAGLNQDAGYRMYYGTMFHLLTRGYAVVAYAGGAWRGRRGSWRSPAPATSRTLSRSSTGR